MHLKHSERVFLTGCPMLQPFNASAPNLTYTSGRSPHSERVFLTACPLPRPLGMHVSNTAHAASSLSLNGAKASQKMARIAEEQEHSCSEDSDAVATSTEAVATSADGSHKDTLQGRGHMWSKDEVHSDDIDIHSSRLRQSSGVSRSFSPGEQTQVLHSEMTFSSHLRQSSGVSRSLSPYEQEQGHSDDMFSNNYFEHSSFVHSRSMSPCEHDKTQTEDTMSPCEHDKTQTEDTLINGAMHAGRSCHNSSRGMGDREHLGAQSFGGHVNENCDGGKSCNKPMKEGGPLKEGGHDHARAESFWVSANDALSLPSFSES